MHESLEVSSSSDKEVYLYFGLNEFRKYKSWPTTPLC